MAAGRTKLIYSLIHKKLYEEIEHIILISKQGFDVHIKTDFVEVEQSIISILEQELRLNSRAFRIVLDPSRLLSNENYEADIEDDTHFIPTLLVSSKSLQSGFGFVNFLIKEPDELLGSVPSSIAKILDHFSLNTYLDSFDSKKLGYLKQITRTRGLSVLIDAVVQTAYLSGYIGNNEKSEEYLENLSSGLETPYGENETSVEKSAEIFLSHVSLKGNSAYTFLKSCLSYYMINLQGLSVSKVSQSLKVSRTTLLEHVKMANELGVTQFFEGGINKVRPN